MSDLNGYYLYLFGLFEEDNDFIQSDTTQIVAQHEFYDLIENCERITVPF